MRLGHWIFHPERKLFPRAPDLKQFLVEEVLSCQIEESLRKKVISLYRNTRLDSSLRCL